MNKVILSITALLALSSAAQADYKELECARFKSHQITQAYQGVYVEETKDIIIEGKSFKHKYVLGLPQTLEDSLRIGLKGHICYFKKGTQS